MGTVESRLVLVDEERGGGDFRAACTDDPFEQEDCAPGGALIAYDFFRIGRAMAIFVRWPLRINVRSRIKIKMAFQTTVTTAPRSAIQTNWIWMAMASVMPVMTNKILC